MTKADADPLDGLIDREDVGMRGGAMNVVRQTPGVRLSRKNNTWLYAVLASLIWVMAVLAFCWARYGLPFNLGAAGAVAGNRIGSTDWLLITAALLGPLILIWFMALLLRRSHEMRAETRELATTALRLANVAKSVEGGGAKASTPSLAMMKNEGDGASPRHLRREVERATHAISALHGQMSAIEHALSKQAAAIDDVAERAERRAKEIASTLNAERSELEAVATRLDAVGGGVKSPRVEPPVAGAALASGLAGTAMLGGAALASSKPATPDVVDLAIQSGSSAASPSWQDEGDDTLQDLDPFDDLGTDGLEDSGEAIPELPGKDALRAAVKEAEQDGMPNFRTPRRGDIDWTKFVRAANFPENENDSQTLDALYEVLTDTEIASLLQSSEDTLASLADIDLYMEDLAPHLAPADDWQRYLTHQGRIGGGEPLRGIFTMPGIQAGLEEQRVSNKRANDSTFSALTDRFMDRYEEMLVRMLSSGVEHSMLVELADTRTGRAYTLLAQAAQRLRNLEAEG